MKFLLPVFAIALLAFFQASAQVVTVQVSLDQDQFLPGESLPVTVRVFNNSGQTLHLGADNDWLTFDVESADHNSGVPNTSAPSVIGAFTLGSSEVATKRVDIAPYFLLKQQGRYSVVATVHIKEWNSDVSSAPKEFDVIDGAELWSRDFGVPSSATNRPPEIRKYILEEANYLRRQLRMYVLVTDQSQTRFFKVSAIGPMVSFSDPEAQLDRLSDLHVLYQSGARTFIYSVVDPNGNIIQREIYDLYGTRPRLGMDKDGNIVVVGGMKRVEPTELPMIKTPDQTPAQKKQ